MTDALLVAQANSLLSDLSAVLGEELALDAAMTCCLQFEGDVDVVIEFAADAQVLTFRSEILLASECTPAMLLAALALNYGQVSAPVCVAADTRSGLLMLFAALRLAEASGAQVVALVHDLVQQSQTRPAELRQAAELLTATGVADAGTRDVSQLIRA